MRYVIYFYLRYLKQVKTPKDLIRFALKKNMNKTVWTLHNVNYTLEDLNVAANRIVWGLTELGLKKGDRVGVWLRNCPEFIAIRLACYKSGFIFCALIDDFSIEQACDVINETGCSVLFYDSTLDPMRFEEKSKVLKVLCYIHLDNNSQLKNSISYSGFLAGQSSEDPGDKIKSSEISAIGFTSGTTGKSKGVVWTHKAWLYSFYHFLLNGGGSSVENPVFLHVVPFSTSGSLVILPSLLTGARNIILQSFNEVKVAEAIDKEKVTHLILPPSFLIELWDYFMANRIKYSFKSLQSILVGSAILYARKWEQMIEAFGPIIQQSYGMAEVLAPLASLKISDTSLQKHLLKSVGKPVSQIKVKLIDTEGWGGIISISSRSSSIGYWDNEELTGKSFRGKWYITGDIGKTDKEGNLYVVDRKQNIMDHNGSKIIPREIEEIIHECEGVKEVCVVKKDNELIAFIAQRRGINIQIETLKDYCTGKLQPYKVPTRFVLMDSLPHSSSGKILKEELVRRMDNAL